MTIPNPFPPEQLAHLDQFKAEVDRRIDQTIALIRHMLTITGGNDHLVAGVIGKMMIDQFNAEFGDELGAKVTEATNVLRNTAVAAAMRLAKRPAVSREQVREQLVAARWGGAKRRLSGFIDGQVPDDPAGERAWLDRQFAVEVDDVLARLEKLGLIDPAPPDPDSQQAPEATP